MKFKEIQFKDTQAQRVYSNYINSIKEVVKPIPAADQQEVLMEFNSHLYEYLQRNPSLPELEALLNAIDKLGTPAEVLKPLVADKLLERATRTFHPFQVFKALLFNLGNGFIYSIFFLLYLFLGTFIFLIFAKLFSNQVGLYFKDDEFMMLGIVKNTAGYEEVLGFWFIPVMGLLTVILYFLITLLLRLKKLFNRKRSSIMKVTLFILCFTVSSTVFAQEIISPEKKEKIDQYVNYFEKHDQLLGHLSIFEKGEVVLDRKIGAKVPQESSTLQKYMIGSITKTFTAILVMQLVEQGDMQLTDKLSNYFPAVPKAEEITIKQLLNHKSGLGSYNVKQDSLYFWLNEPVTSSAIMEEIIRQGVAFSPGDKQAYSNSAYYLLAGVLEKAYEQPFREIVTRQITKPFGLQNTFVIDEESTVTFASSYEKNGQQWQTVKDFYLPNVGGAGNIVSTPADLNKLLKALFSGQLVKEETLQAMLPQKKEVFGLGFMRIPFNKIIAYGHGGDTFGTHTVVAYNPDNQLSVAYVINGENYPTNDFAIGLFSVIYEQDYTLPTFADYQPEKRFYPLYEGWYSADDFPIKIKIYQEGEALYAQGEGQPSFRLTPVARHQFAFQRAGVKMAFKPSEGTLQFEQGGKQFELTKQ
ncbi:MAG: serine hydrolase domain-containing protein [Thermonemataceae bacterium]